MMLENNLEKEIQNHFVIMQYFLYIKTLIYDHFHNICLKQTNKSIPVFCSYWFFNVQ